MLGNQPSLRFKLDPTDDWPQELITQLAALGVVDVVDMKGQYGDDMPFAMASTPGDLPARGRGLPARATSRTRGSRRSCARP